MGTVDDIKIETFLTIVDAFELAADTAARDSVYIETYAEVSERIYRIISGIPPSIFVVDDDEITLLYQEGKLT